MCDLCLRLSSFFSPPPSPSLPPSLHLQVFGGDSDEEDLPGSQGVKEGGALSKTQRLQQEEEADDEFDFIVDDHGQPIRRRREDGTYTEP